MTVEALSPAPLSGHPDDHAPAAGENYLNTPRGILSWLVTVDHKRIGVMYLALTSLAFLAGGILALIIRIKLMSPGDSVVSADRYNQLFTLHGAIMIFLFIIPSIPAALGNFLLPLMIGARDVAFPKLNLASLYVYILGAIVSLYSIVHAAVDTGWTFYTPYSVETQGAVVSMTFGLFILGFSSIFTGLNFIVTTHTMRAPGMTWFRMPLLVWGLYATSIIQVLATPVLGITLLLLAVERLFGLGIFDPKLGGDPVLFQHFFWFYSHPAVYIMILPAMGVISEVITTHARKTIFGYRFVAYSSIAIALVSFLVWGHHMFTSQSKLSSVIFSFLTFLVAIPSAIKVFNWLATLYRGSIALTAPLLYSLIFLFLFTIGGLTGVMLGALGLNVHLHGTYFIVAHFHYVMVGGTVMAFIAGLHHWWPKMFGRMYSATAAAIAAALVFLGFNITFFTQFIAGMHGMPRRYYHYAPEYHVLNIISTVGSWLLAVGLVMIPCYLLWSLWRGRPAGDNPWGGRTLEWQTSSPPITHNFIDLPTVSGGPYEYGVEPEEATVR